MEKKALLDAQPADSKGWPQRVITSLERRLQQLRLAPPFGLGKRADDHTTQRFYRLLSIAFFFFCLLPLRSHTRVCFEQAYDVWRRPSCLPIFVCCVAAFCFLSFYFSDCQVRTTPSSRLQCRKYRTQAAYTDKWRRRVLGSRRSSIEEEATKTSRRICGGICAGSLRHTFAGRRSALIIHRWLIVRADLRLICIDYGTIPPLAQQACPVEWWR